MDEVYTRTTLDRLVEGQIWKGPSSRKGNWCDVDGAWAEVRSQIEQTGDIESSGWLEVMDLENAIASLRGAHPEAALVVIAVMFGFSRDELRVFRNFEVLLERGKAWLSAYLSGRDPEVAYRRAGERRGAMST